MLRPKIAYAAKSMGSLFLQKYGFPPQDLYLVGMFFFEEKFSTID